MRKHIGAYLALLILLTFPVTSFINVHAAQEQKEPAGKVSYNAGLEGYPYPFPVSYFNFKSQNQDLNMAYMYIEGKKDKPVVVLLHGKNFMGAYWEETAKFVNDLGYGVLMPDQIGFGKSTKPLYYQFGFPQLSANTRELITHLGINKVIIIGHSMGGMLATRFALMYPEETEKLILVNPIGLEDYLKYVRYKDAQFFYKNELAKTPADVKEYMKKNYYDGKWKPEYDRWVLPFEGWINGPDRERIAWNSALTYDMIFSEPVYNEFKDLRVPTYLIIGTRDTTGPGRGWKKEGVTRELGQYDVLGEQAAAIIPDAELFELEALGHMPHIEDFSSFSKALKTALGNSVR